METHPAATPDSSTAAAAPVVKRRAWSRLSGWGAIVGCYALAVVGYGWAASRVELPIFFPDEFTYGNLSQSIAAGHGATWWGASQGVRSLLYMYLIAPAWLPGSRLDGYAIAKWLNALMACAVVFPVWLLARRLMHPRLALVPAALSALGTWMASTGVLMTENAGYPLATAALASTVMAVRRPASRWWVAALVFAGLGAYARLQLVVLVPVVLGALALDVARQGRGAWRAAARERAVGLGVLGGLTFVGVVLFLADGASLLGSHSGVESYSPGIGALLRDGGKHGLALILMVGVLPLVATLAVVIRPRNWRDETSGPVLTVLASATLIFGAEAAWYAAGYGSKWPIDRYVVYLAPLIFVVMMLAPGRVSPRSGAAVGVALSLLLLASPDVLKLGAGEQRALYGTTKRLGQLGGVFADHPTYGLVLLSALIGIPGIVLLARAPAARQRRTLLIASGVVAALLLVQSQAVWQRQLNLARTMRATLPTHLDWVDRAVDQPVAVFDTTYDNIRNYRTMFFNKRIDRIYRTLDGLIVRGRACDTPVGEDGTLSVDPSCGDAREALMPEDTVVRATFYDETELATNPPNARLVTVASPPRVLSLIRFPCLPKGGAFAEGNRSVRPCSGALTGQLWLDEVSAVVMHFRGGTTLHYGRSGETVYTFPPGRMTDVRIQLAPGAQTLNVQLDWTSTAESPTLVGIDLEQAGGATRIL